jgi:hypothetical protein
MKARNASRTIGMIKDKNIRKQDRKMPFRRTRRARTVTVKMNTPIWETFYGDAGWVQVPQNRDQQRKRGRVKEGRKKGKKKRKPDASTL